MLYLNNCKILSDKCLSDIEDHFRAYMHAASEEESVACISRGLQEFGKGLIGKSSFLVEKAMEDYVSSNKHLFFPYSSDLVKLIKTYGYEPVAVSRVPNMEAIPVAKYLGIDIVHAIDFETDSTGRYTGRISPYCPINGTKELVFNQYLPRESGQRLLAIGNQEGDFPMKDGGCAFPGILIHSKETPIKSSLMEFAEKNNLLVVCPYSDNLTKVEGYLGRLYN
jgi:hypothetical protein